MTATLLLPNAGTESLSEYRGSGGLRFTGTPAELVTRVAAADLRGRGGAGFPLARKLSAVAGQADSHRVVVANGEEGEPGSVKDRTLMRTRPFLVLDGLLLAAYAVDAREAFVYVSDDTTATAMSTAIAELAAPLPVVVVTVAHTYVAGEESAVARAIDGGPALPTAKPPRAFEQGVGTHPTLVSNVETLAHLALLANHGTTAYGAGALLVTLSGTEAAPALYEVPLGARLGDVVDAHSRATITGVLMGGLFGGLLGPEALELSMGHDAMREAGTSLGCGAFFLLTDADCVVEVITDAVAHLDRESAQQCGSCFKGTAAMSDALTAIAHGRGTDENVEGLGRWSQSLVGRGNCALLDAACGLVASLLSRHGDLVSAHLRSACRICAKREDFSDTRLRIDMDLPEGTLA